MKKMLHRLAALSLCAALCMGLTAGVEAVPPPMEEWTNDNAIEFSVKPEYRDEVLADPEGAFAGLHPAGTYITRVSKKDGGWMDILLVLSESGKQVQQEAIQTLLADPRVSYVRKCMDAPFEDVNTLQLSAEANTIHVGERVAIKPEGEIRIYSSPYSRLSLCATPKDFDPNKEYTVEDFPQLPLKEVKEYSYGEIYEGGYDEIYEFALVLDKENPDYFDFIRAADLLARSSDISNVHLNPIVGTMRWSEFCTVSDSSVAQFTNTKTDDYVDGELVGKANEDNEYILEGLGPGKVTVTYYHYGYHGSPYTAQMDITVLDNEPQSSDGDDTPQNDFSEINNSQSNNPKTGDVSPLVAVGLLALAGMSVFYKFYKTEK